MWSAFLYIQIQQPWMHFSILSQFSKRLAASTTWHCYISTYQTLPRLFPLICLAYTNNDWMSRSCTTQKQSFSILVSEAASITLVCPDLPKKVFSLTLTTARYPLCGHLHGRDPFLGTSLQFQTMICCNQLMMLFLCLLRKIFFYSKSYFLVGLQYCCIMSTLISTSFLHHGTHTANSINVQHRRKLTWCMQHSLLQIVIALPNFECPADIHLPDRACHKALKFTTALWLK